MNLSLIVPAYNAGITLRPNMSKLSSYLSKLVDDFEIIVVDDCSTDGSTADCDKIPNTIILRESCNKGKGYALRKGFVKSKGRFVIYTDADVPYELIDLDAVLYYLKNGFHIVIGDRTLSGSTYYPHQFKRRVMSKVFTKFTTMVVTGGIGDTQCGLKGFQGDVGRCLFSLSRVQRFAIDVEILYIALKHCLDIKHIPVHPMYTAQSSIDMLSDPVQMIKDVLRIKLNYERKIYTSEELMRKGLPHCYSRS